MKKLNVLVLALLALTLGFTTSCDPEGGTDFAAPTVAFTQGNQTVDPGTAVVLTGTVKASAGLDEIVFFKGDVSYGDAITRFDTDTTHSFSVTIPADQVEETFPFEVQATDKDGQTGKATATVTVTTEPTLSITEHTGVTMYAQDAANNMAFNAANGSAGTTSAIAADDIDLLLIFQNADDRKHGLYAPSDGFVGTMAAYGSWDWSGTHNATKVSASTMDFANVTAEDIDGMSVSGSAVTVLAVGDVVAFETVDGYKGLIKVSATALNKQVESDANITFDAKIVAPAADAK
jgi:hypothetical protein